MKLGISPGFGIPTEDEFAAIKATGAKCVRVDVRWNELDNNEDGTLDVDLSNLDDAIAYCDSIDLDVWLLANGGTDDMNLAAGLPKYAAYIANLAEHLDGVTRVIAIECGNEVGSGPWGQNQNPYHEFKGQAYAHIMIRVYDPLFEDVKSRSDRPIFAGSTARADPLSYFMESHGRGENDGTSGDGEGPHVIVGGTTFNDGMRGHYDGICLHPYDERKYASESIDPGTQQGGTWELTRVMAWLLAEFGDVPDLAITEYGFPSYDASSPPADSPAILAESAGAVTDAMATYADLASTNGWTIPVFTWFTFMDKLPDDWRGDSHAYTNGDYVIDAGVTYKCTNSHTSSSGNRPPHAFWNVEDDKKWHWGLVKNGTTFPIPNVTYPTAGWVRKPIYAAFQAAAANEGSGVLGGGGAFTATGTRTRFGSLVRLLGGGTFTASSVDTLGYGSGPYGSGPYGGGSNSGVLAGGGSFTATGTRTVRASLVRLLGGGTFTATSVRTVFAAAHLAGGGTFTATATRAISGTASFSGGGTFTATGTGIPNGTALLDGGGTFTATAALEVFAAGLLLGGGTFTVDIPVPPDPAAPIVLPDVIAATVSWLNTATEVTALIANRVGTRLPATEVWPAIRIDPTGGFAIYEFRLDQPNLQIQCFDTTDLAAMTVARTVRASLVAMAGYRIPNNLVVVDVTTSSPRLLDDQARTPSIAHATFNATVTVRPDP